MHFKTPKTLSHNRYGFSLFYHEELADLSLAKTYWLKQFEDDIPVLELKTDRENLATALFQAVDLALEIDSRVLSGLTKLNKSPGDTLFTAMFSCLNLLLYRYTGQQDIVIGSLISDQQTAGKILALRNRFEETESCEQLFQKSGEVISAALLNQLYTVEELTVALNHGKPLFDVLMLWNNTPPQDAEFTFKGTPAVSGYADQQVNWSDINFIFTESDTGIRLVLKYNKNAYSGGQMTKMLQHFENIIAEVARNSKQNLAEIDFLTKQDKQKLLKEFNNTTVEYPADKTIVELFEEQVQKTPGNRAVIFENVELSYLELNGLSNRFADYLRKKYGVKPDDLVGIMLERSEWMIIVIFGILKAGGAYVPIAPDYPLERISYLVQDSACKVLIDDEELRKFKDSQSKYSQENQSVGLQPHNLAYCIYTSGSTGNPKGCLLQHTGLVNRLAWMQKAYPLSEQDVILQKTTFSFDVSVWELIWWSLQGASVCMLAPGGEKSPELIIDTVSKYKASVMHFVPSMLSVFLEFLENDAVKLNQLKSLKQVFTSGEALTFSQAERFNELFATADLMNLYGPTEASIDVTYFDCRKENLENSVPIGKPIDNTQIYIVDKFRNLMPAGAVGEICLGGVGLARGYLNRPELTAEKFIPNPFIPGQRIYRTGDLGRWRPDGNIEYLGRIDDQVKIRGFRIELDEISSVLQQYDKVKDAIVIARAVYRQDKELVAYYTGDAHIAELKEFLKGQLPAYMVPMYYVKMDSIPLTSNGKANRKALPFPDTSATTAGAYVGPTTDTEKILVTLWSEVLGVPQETLSIKSDFFDLGGHSIKAIRLLGLIHKNLGVKLPLKEFFTECTIEKQASIISERDLDSYKVIEVIPDLPAYKLSSAQRRLWILNHFEGAQSAYNIFSAVLLEGRLNRAALKKAFAAMAERHEILRTVFREDKDGLPRQQVLNAKKHPFTLVETDLSDIRNKNAQLNQIVEQENSAGFDLAHGPLWRCHLVTLEKEKHILFMVHHHIISDGWSMDVFRKEWCTIYNALASNNTAQLSTLPIQYKDYAAWHNKQLESDEIIPHKAYWLQQFAGEIPILDLPAENQRPAVKTFNGASLTTTFDSSIADKLSKVSKELGGTLFMSLLTCVNALLYRYTGQQDIVVGSPIAGRQHPDLEDQIGFYINTLALRTRFDGTTSFEDLFLQIKDVTLNAYEHQLYPYDELVESLKLPRNINRNPLFDIMVVLQNSMEQDAAFELNGLQASPFHTGEYRVAKFDINFTFSESARGLDLFLEYNTDIYGIAQIKRMLSHFENLVFAFVGNPKLSPAEIDILTKDERHELFGIFNDTLASYPKEKTLTDIFEQQVINAPDSIALRQHGRTMTYNEVNQQANQLARYLLERGINKGDHIALLLSRSFDMIIAMLGVLKAGAVYIPIDPEYPAAGQEYILNNSPVKKVLTDGDYPVEKLIVPDLLIKLKTLDLSAYDTGNSGIIIDSSQLAYILYPLDAGSEKPKGIMTEHHMAVNLILSVNSELEMGPGERILFFNSINSGRSVYDIFGMLAAGGSLEIVGQSELADPVGIKNRLIRENISVWNSAPAFAGRLLRELQPDELYDLQAKLKVALISGSAFSCIQALDFPNTRVVSLAGVTEATIWSSFRRIEQAGGNMGSPHRGRPLKNNFLYILNEKHQPAPMGVVGELYIGGAGVALGYANDKSSTDYAFIDDPFNKQAGGRMYRSGYLGRMLPDLTMELIGRREDEVLFRGCRVDLDLIGRTILACETVSQAVVLAKTDRHGKRRLVCYAVAKGNYDRNAVISFLHSRLPRHMVPEAWVEIDVIPLSAGGEIDKKSLLDLNIEELVTDQYVAPHTESERILVKIWQDVLKVNNIGVRDDFFDLGGHSLLAVQIVNQIKKRTGKFLPISALFKYSNIESLGAFLMGNETEKISRSLVPIKPALGKMPIYFIHGVGLNVMNFADLAMSLDARQPVFGLQALGLGGEFPPVKSMSEIAEIYISEILEHNPNGPYAIAGYSLGGFIALEIKRQLELSGRKLSLLAMIDTNADHTEDFIALLPKKIKRHVGRWLNFITSFVSDPKKAIEDQRNIILEERNYRYDAIKLAKESGDAEYYKLLKNIRTIYYKAYEKSRITPFDDTVHLFRASTCVHYTNDLKYLGWEKYALRGVKEYEIPGDHRTMLLKPNVDEFARVLQQVLNECNK